MIKNITIATSCLIVGVLFGILFVAYTPFFNSSESLPFIPNSVVAGPKQIIGFLPYWLLSKAKTDYSSSITTLTYFALKINSDGSIVKLNSPTEEEPGWYDLKSGKVNEFFASAKKNNLRLSLTLDSGNMQTINMLISDPENNGKRIVASVLPIMQQYGFSDLNLDIEYTSSASEEARLAFTKLIQIVKSNLPKPLTLTLEISPADVISDNLIESKSISKYADTIVLMAYDYHSPDSFIAGPVAPLFGAGIDSEYDVATAVKKSLEYIPPNKLVVGIPLYGYEWETIDTTPRSAIIPGSGVIASNSRVSNLLSTCATCSATEDKNAQESFLTYFSFDTQTNHFIFFPDEKSTAAKIDFVNKNSLSGIALWALGYEGDTILNPVQQYKSN